MAAARPSESLASTPRWFVSIAGKTVIGGAIWTLIISVASAPTIFLLPVFYPAAVPFGWLAVIGIVAPLVNPEFTGGEVSAISDIVSRYQSKPPTEKLIYALSLWMIIVGGLSFLVALLALFGGYLAAEMDAGAVGFALAIFYPSVDSWLNRRFGWNASMIGGAIALVLMTALAVVYRVSPTVPRQAASDLRASITAA